MERAYRFAIQTIEKAPRTKKSIQIGFAGTLFDLHILSRIEEAPIRRSYSQS